MQYDTKPLSVGAVVPDFEMETYDPAIADFGKVALADLKRAGQWSILVFYPADFTFVCPTELADLADKHPALQKLGATVVAVSTDTKFAHMAWRNSEGEIALPPSKIAFNFASAATPFFVCNMRNNCVATSDTWVTW